MAKPKDKSKKSDKSEEPELPFHWEQVQTAIWLIGLAIVAWQGWWWPGMLVLVGISGLTQAGISLYVKRQEEAAAEAARAAAVAAQEAAIKSARVRGLPTTCPFCGATLDGSRVEWRSDTVATCPYCTGPVAASIPDTSQKAEPAS
jgi:hypothetical protein